MGPFHKPDGFEEKNLPKKRYISLFSGIEAASVAWQPFGWEALAFSEIEKFPSDLLSIRFPSVENKGDIQLVDWRKYHGATDIVIGGSPCQSFSVAGLRRGLLDPRGNLMLSYLRAVREIRPTWTIWENVPGVLSIDGGRAFATLLKGMEECGFGVAYKVCDAQFHGVAQRRRRVFVVGCAGGQWQRAAAVLFDSESLSWNFKTSREARETLARASGDGAAYAIAGNIIGRKDGCGGNGLGIQEEVSYTLTTNDKHSVAVLPFDTTQITSKSNRSNPKFGDPCHTLLAGAHPPTVFLSSGKDVVGTLCASDCKGVSNQYVNDGKLICIAPTFPKRPNQQLATNSTELSYALTTGSPPSVCTRCVRRLTPVECERLQGFPDNYTDIYEKTPDTPRYKALGNSMAVPVIKWLGRRIATVERIVGSDGPQIK